MSPMSSLIGLVRSWASTRAASGNNDAVPGSRLLGVLVGSSDGYAGHPYDDSFSRKHPFTIVVPEAGASAYAAGYRDGYLSGQAERHKIHIH
jgi:hypothetical protein